MRLLPGERLVRWASGEASWVLLKCALTAALLAATSVPSRADESAKEPEFGWREMWLGADVSQDVWLIYTGVTLAPLSKDMYSDGLRLRLNSGYGQYSYKASNTLTRHCPAKAQAGQLACIDVDVDISYVDALVGYQVRFGELTAKVFAGASMVSHKASEKALGNSLLTREFGPTGALELWLNLGEQGWTSLDLSFTTAHDTGAARWRAGWRALPTLSIGPEIRFDRNSLEGSGRIGAFARYEWLGGEISVAGGVAQRMRDPWNEKIDNINGTNNDIDKELTPYATINFLTQF